MQRAKGDLQISWRTRDDGTTALSDLRQEGCLKARFPRPQDWPEAVTLNSSGGVAGGDSLTQRFQVGEHARATITSQAAERFYRALPGDPPATIRTTLTLAAHSSAEWLPQESILFDRCALDRRLDIAMDATASLLAVETLVFGRALMGETVRTARLRDLIRIRRGEKLILHDATRLEGNVATTLAHRASTNGAIAVATVIHVAPEAESRRDALRAAWSDTAGEAACSAWNGMLVARIVAPDSATMRATLIAGLAVLRGARPLPRVWSC